MITKKKIELLAPAGNLEILKVAVDSGADSVYLGLKEYSARAEQITLPLMSLKKA